MSSMCVMVLTEVNQ